MTRQFAMKCHMALMIGAILLLPRSIVRAAEDGPDAKDVQELIDKAIAYLKKHQGEDGSFAPKIAGPGVSALVAASLLQNGVSTDDPLVAKTLAYLEKKVQKDGGIYDKQLANYTTSVAIMAFVEANSKGKYDSLIKNASKFIKKLQFEDVDEKDPKYGGVGYDKGKRPDMSNTQLFLDALLAAGVPKDDPSVQRTLKFISRCQNLPGETNDQAFTKKTTDDDKGGLGYSPFIDPDDKVHCTPDGGLRSLGAMTYAGLKSFLFAGVEKNDPRVKAATLWIRKHYTLEENPGLGKAGLYYYYHTFGKGMTALGENPFVDAKGTKHAWRKELFEALKKRQKEDGSWINEGDKQFGESSPELATAFAVLTLTYCKPAKGK